MSMRVEFRLTMPNVGSWNGRWSGEDRDYRLVRSVTPEQWTASGMDRGITSWHHSWGDGWGAQVSARVMAKGERSRKSDGFCGYDWMVRNILDHGHTRCICEWVSDARWTTDTEEWERCPKCGTSRQVLSS